MGKRNETARRAMPLIGLVLTLMLASGCSSPTDPPPNAASPPVVEPSRAQATPTPAATLCATLPSGSDGTYEGWFNSTPADAEGRIITDPQEWPDEIREHPSVVLVNTWTNQVVASYDRVDCGPVEGWQLPLDTSTWPSESVVVVDASTNEVVEHLAVGRDEPGSGDPGVEG